MKRKILFLISVIFICILISACGKTPQSQMKGKIIENIKVEDGDYIYELLASDTVTGHNDNFEDYCQAKVFVQKKKGKRYVTENILDIEKRLMTAKQGLCIADVDFDGKSDILVSRGEQGISKAISYIAYLGKDGGYEPEESFAQILNPAPDYENKVILSSYRNSDVSFGWGMYKIIDGKYIMTNRLTESMSNYSDNNASDYSLSFTDEVFENNAWTIKEKFTNEDYTKAEIDKKIMGEGSFWNLNPERYAVIK